MTDVAINRGVFCNLTLTQLAIYVFNAATNRAR